MNAFKFQILIEAQNRANGALGALQEKLQGVERTAKGLEHLRGVGQHMMMVGGGIAAVGAGIGYGLKKAVDAYGALQDAQQHLLTTLPKSAEGMRELKAATELANQASVKYNVSQEDVLENVYLGVSAGLNFHQAMVNALSSIQVAKGTQGDIAETGRTMGQIVKLFGDAKLSGAAATAQIQHFADITAYAVRQKAFKNVGELNTALGESIGSAKAAGMGYQDLLATLAGFQQAGLTGGMAGEALEESLQAIGRGGFAKAGVAVATFKNGATDVIGTLVNLKRAYSSGAVTLAQFMILSKALGVRGTRALALNAADLIKARDEFASSAVKGAALEGADIIMRSMNEQIGRALKGFTELQERIGKVLAPSITSAAEHFVHLFQALNAFATAHPKVVKFVVTFAALAAAVAILVGGFIAVAGAIAFALSFLGSVGLVAAAIGGIGIAAAAAAAAIETWGWGVFRVFGRLLLWIGSLPTKFFDAGIHLAMALGRGITAGMMYPVHAVESLAQKIRGYLPFSPAREGPLRDLHRVRIVQEIAESIRPAPMLTAMRRVAAAAMIAAPMMMAGAPALAAPMKLPAPALAAGGGIAGGALNYSPTINVTVNGPGDKDAIREAVLDAIRDHADEIRRTQERVHAIRARREF
jgi:TP901 family phage tail tape measure protein